MSKQSRARARRHNNKKKVGTEAMAPTMIVRVQRMSDSNRYSLMQELLDSLHAELCKKQSTWGTDTMNMFYCELWTELMKQVEMQRKSQAKARTMQLILDIKICKSIL